MKDEAPPLPANAAQFDHGEVTASLYDPFDDEAASVGQQRHERSRSKAAPVDGVADRIRSRLPGDGGAQRILHHIPSHPEHRSHDKRHLDACAQHNVGGSSRDKQNQRHPLQHERKNGKAVHSGSHVQRGRDSEEDVQSADDHDSGHEQQSRRVGSDALDRSHFLVPAAEAVQQSGEEHHRQEQRQLAADVRQAGPAFFFHACREHIEQHQEYAEACQPVCSRVGAQLRAKQLGQRRALMRRGGFRPPIGRRASAERRLQPVEGRLQRREQAGRILGRHGTDRQGRQRLPQFLLQLHPFLVIRQFHLASLPLRAPARSCRPPALSSACEALCTNGF
ncbi:hypothetical protein BN871_AM_00440 [Paenibacillus sp. P22]|nr:hypothetical protein BN871_AM_00440 [Paenibacillus sp. P22]